MLFPGGYGPTGGANNESAVPEFSEATGHTANTPKPNRPRLSFSPTVDQHWMFDLQIPDDYASGGIVRGRISTSASTGTVVMKTGLCKSTGSDVDDAFSATVNTTNVPITVANQREPFTINLPMAGIAANDDVTIFIGRDADNGSDSVDSNAAYLHKLSFEYVTA